MSLDQIGPRLDPALLPTFGLRRWREREAESTYYLLGITPIRSEARLTNRLITCLTHDGATVRATCPVLDERLVGIPNWAILVTHPSPFGRDHCHLLKIWPHDPELADQFGLGIPLRRAS